MKITIDRRAGMGYLYLQDNREVGCAVSTVVDKDYLIIVDHHKDTQVPLGIEFSIPKGTTQLTVDLYDGNPIVIDLARMM